jgi:hypothetical protein
MQHTLCTVDEEKQNKNVPKSEATLALLLI